MTDRHTDTLNAPGRALGLRPPIDAPALRLSTILRAVPAHPAAVDHYSRVSRWLLGANNTFSTCGPTSVANLLRLVYRYLLGEDITVANPAIFDLYRRSGNPGFDPKTGADDNGVIMQKMLGALTAGGIQIIRADGSTETVKAVAYAKVKVGSLDEVRAAISIFGGILFGLDLQVAQERQTDANPPVWDYSPSGTWGGHAVLGAGYSSQPSGVDIPDVTWAKLVGTTDRFMAHQAREAWVVVLPAHLAHPAFQDGVDLGALGSAYKALTGRDLPVPVTPPPPPPDPQPADPARKLAAATRAWATAKHSGKPGEIAAALRTFYAEVGV